MYVVLFFSVVDTRTGDRQSSLYFVADAAR